MGAAGMGGDLGVGTGTGTGVGESVWVGGSQGHGGGEAKGALTGLLAASDKTHHIGRLLDDPLVVDTDLDLTGEGVWGVRAGRSAQGAEVGERGQALGFGDSVVGEPGPKPAASLHPSIPGAGELPVHPEARANAVGAAQGTLPGCGGLWTSQGAAAHRDGAVRSSGPPQSH